MATVPLSIVHMTSLRRSMRSSFVVFIVGILLGGQLVNACGPGRGYGRRRPSRPPSPLVYKQHVPNVAEETIGASGAPEGRITRDDPRFDQLVRVDDENIVFKDEEGTGEDKVMTPVWDIGKYLCVAVADSINFDFR